jgi:N-methylhydantoinase A
MRTAIEVAAQELGLSGKVLLSKTDMLIYGTTRATNAVVSTAKTAFLTTQGFRDRGRPTNIAWTTRTDKQTHFGPR